MSESKAVESSLKSPSDDITGKDIGALKWSDYQKMLENEDNAFGSNGFAGLDENKGATINESKLKTSAPVELSVDAIERRERVAREAKARRSEMRKMMMMNKVKLMKDNNEQIVSNIVDAKSAENVVKPNEVPTDTEGEGVTSVKKDDSNSIDSAQKEEEASITDPSIGKTETTGEECKLEKIYSTAFKLPVWNAEEVTATVEKKVAEVPDRNQNHETTCDDSRFTEKKFDKVSAEESTLTNPLINSISSDSSSKFSIIPMEESDVSSYALSEYSQLSKSSSDIGCENIFSKSFFDSSLPRKSPDGRLNDPDPFPLEDTSFNSLYDHNPSIENLLKVHTADSANDLISDDAQTLLEPTRQNSELFSSSILGGSSDHLSTQDYKTALVSPSDALKLDEIRANTHQKLKEVMANYELSLTRYVERKLGENQTNFQERNVFLQRKNLELEKSLLKLSEEHELLTAKYANASNEVDFLKARISLLESKLSTLQGNLELKVHESAQLTQLCNELITRLESNSKV